MGSVRTNICPFYLLEDTGRQINVELFCRMIFLMFGVMIYLFINIIKPSVEILVGFWMNWFTV